MSEEIKEEQVEEKPIQDFRKRSQVSKEVYKEAQVLDLEASAKFFEDEFTIYCLHPNMDLSEYADENGNVGIEDVPRDKQVRFTCRYIDPGTFQEVLDSPIIYDLPTDRPPTQKEIEEAVRKAAAQKLKRPETEAEIRANVIFKCVTYPAFKSPEQVKHILPATIQIELYDEIMRGAIGDNIVARFQNTN